MLVPSLVTVQQQRAAEAGFVFSSEDGTGQLLAVLCAAVRPNGRILEIGTGMGVGLAWIASGLGSRTDVTVTTIEQDPERSGLAQASEWPPWIDFVVGDATTVLPGLASFDLIFADAEGGKWYGLELTLAALSPGGILLLDDLVPQDWKSEPDKAAHIRKIEEIRQQLNSDPRLITTEMSHASGLLLACRQS
jgi:predicted O-methyltransferase YrrM